MVIREGGGVKLHMDHMFLQHTDSFYIAHWIQLYILMDWMGPLISGLLLSDTLTSLNVESEDTVKGRDMSEIYGKNKSILEVKVISGEEDHTHSRERSMPRSPSQCCVRFWGWRWAIWQEGEYAMHNPYPRMQSPSALSHMRISAYRLGMRAKKSSPQAKPPLVITRPTAFFFSYS